MSGSHTLTGLAAAAQMIEANKMQPGSATVHVVRTIPKRATRALRQMLERRAAIEPTIGHLRSDNGLNRNYLTGREGDKINALLSAAGYNLRKLLRWVVFVPIFRLWWWLKAFLSAKPARCRQDLSPALP